ncbi:hypothetical protein SAFG77S_00013 [Streptomyces afghaniensis]
MSVVAGARCTGAVTPDSSRSSSSRRSVSGASISDSSPSASRSKATNEAGVRSASIRTRESAGWIRSVSASKSRCPSRAITISPSTTERSGNRSRTAVTSSGKYLVKGFPVRLPSSTSSPSRKTIARNPSHFASYCMPEGIVATDLASIGSTGGITGRSML